MILRLHDPDEGAVRIDGHDVRDLRLDSLREAIAAVMQETLVLQATVRENIAVGRPGATDEQIVAAARAAGADGFIAGLSQGYDTLLDARGRSLSGRSAPAHRHRTGAGARRARAAAGRAIDGPRRDDPPAPRGTDARADARSHRASVISHDLLTVHDADRIVVLEAGRIVESGPHDALLAAGGLYARLFRERSAAGDAVTA